MLESARLKGCRQRAYNLSWKDYGNWPKGYIAFIGKYNKLKF